MATTNTYALFLSLSFSLFIICYASSSSEADILLTFKASVEDPMNYLSSWSNTTYTHYCNWTGVTCSTSISLSIFSLNLQTLNLSGEISPSICQLPNLNLLNLANNHFNQPIPLHLSQCISLVTLNLSNNLIWGTIPDQISQFGSMRFLDLNTNHIEGEIPETIGSLKNLQALNLGNNLLSEYGHSKKATEQMDTYSFGVVLLELVTGRQAEKTESGDSLDVVKWVRRKVNISNGELQVLDPKISSCSHQEMFGALEIALRCTCLVPEKRPSMFEIVRALQSLDSKTNLPNIESSVYDECSVPL